MGCGNKLVSPALSSGQTLTGYIINKIFGAKAIYLRPNVGLFNVKVPLFFLSLYLSINNYHCMWSFFIAMNANDAIKV